MDDMPMALEYVTIPAFCLPNLEAVDTSLYTALERTENRPTRTLQRLRAMPFSAEYTELLSVQNGNTSLFIERRCSLKSGQAIEVT